MKDKAKPPELSFHCPKKWDSMQAAGPHQRFCDQCQLHVHDLSAMSEREVKKHLADVNGQHCVSYEYRADGSMVIRTIWTRVGKPWLALGRKIVTLIAMVVPLGLASCANRNNVNRTAGEPCPTNYKGKDDPVRKGDEIPPRTMGRIRMTGAVAPSTDTSH